MNGGFTGKILKIDLARMESEVLPLPVHTAARFIGGLGMTVKLACDCIPPATDPLGPENVIVLGAGPFVGTDVPASSRVYAVTKLPQPRTIGWAGGGGFVFGTALKNAGFDHIIIKGRASFPVYLEIINGSLNIRKADAIWGMGVDQTTEFLTRKYGTDTGVLAIGPAGENGVLFSIAFIDAVSTIGRGGLGAVMGSKNLKAVVVRGNLPVTVAHPDAYRKIVHNLIADIKNFPHLKEWQDLGLVKSFSFIPPEMYKKIKKKRLACISCPIGDKDLVEIREGDHCGLVKKTSSAVNLFMPMIYGMSAYQDCVKIIAILDDLGMDMFEFFGILDYAGRLIKTGAMPEDATGPPIATNEFNATRAWADSIAKRRGLGKVLAEGFDAVRKYCDLDDRHEDIPLVKGMMPYVGPQGPLPWNRFGTMELGQVLEQRGPHVGSGGSPTYFAVRPLDKFPAHMKRMGMTEEEIARVLDEGGNESSTPDIKIGKLLVHSQNWFAILGSLGLCARAQVNRFFTLETCASLYRAVTGIDLSPADLKTGADRIWTLLRYANGKQGIDRTQDRIPVQWIRNNPFQNYVTGAPMTSEDYEMCINDYYEERHWDKVTGLPTEERMAELFDIK